MKEKIIRIHDWQARVSVAPAEVGLEPYEVEVPRNYLIECLYLREEIAIQDDGAGAAPTYNNDAGIRLSARIEFETETDTPIAASGRMLTHYNQLCNAVDDDIEATPAAIGALHEIVHVTRIPYADYMAKSLPAKLETMFLGLKRTTANFRATPSATAQIMTAGAGGAVAMILSHFTLFAKVIELTTKEEVELFKKAQRYQLRIREEAQEIVPAAGLVFAPFLNKHMNRGNQTLGFMTMCTDAEVRTPDMPDQFGVNIGDIPYFPVPCPEELITKEVMDESGYAIPDGIHYLNLDKSHNHESAPWTVGTENFYLNRAINGAGAGLFRVLHIEKSSARYREEVSG
jgi:hypothetical protein